MLRSRARVITSVVVTVLIFGAILGWTLVGPGPQTGSSGGFDPATPAASCTPFAGMSPPMSNKQVIRWSVAIQPAVAACPRGYWDISLIDWSAAPFVQPFS
jgi:hypothetical protein